MDAISHIEEQQDGKGKEVNLDQEHLCAVGRGNFQIYWNGGQGNVAQTANQWKLLDACKIR